MIFSVNLMFSELDKFDGTIFRGRGRNIRGGALEGAYFRDVNWFTHLVEVY